MRQPRSPGVIRLVRADVESKSGSGEEWGAERDRRAEGKKEERNRDDQTGRGERVRENESGEKQKAGGG